MFTRPASQAGVAPASPPPPIHHRVPLVPDGGRGGHPRPREAAAAPAVVAAAATGGRAAAGAVAVAAPPRLRPALCPRPSRPPRPRRPPRLLLARRVDSLSDPLQHRGRAKHPLRDGAAGSTGAPPARRRASPSSSLDRRRHLHCRRLLCGRGGLARLLDGLGGGRPRLNSRLLGRLGCDGRHGLMAAASTLSCAAGLSALPTPCRPARATEAASLASRSALTAASKAAAATTRGTARRWRRRATSSSCPSVRGGGRGRGGRSCRGL